jgi:hypothetical protein
MPDYRIFGSIFLNRQEAVSLIKEITEEKCTNLVGHDIMLMLPNADDKSSQGYSLHIKTVLDRDSLRCLEVIVAHNGYVLKNDPDKRLLVIFKPKQAIEYEETGIM